MAAAAVVVTLAYTCFTQHAWEDYFITLRTSRNLVEGHGLVFQPGERLHTFTSPLGVLLPALTLWIGGSVIAGLWLFRALAVAALAAAVMLVDDTAVRLRWPAVARWLVAGMILLDAKTVDNAINGMETAFVLLGLALLIRAHFVPGPHAFRRIGLAIGLLQWARPDSFIYVAAVAAGFLVFPGAQNIAAGRGRLIQGYVRATAVALCLYGPWLAWAWWYYGSPVPHTILAKGLHHVKLDWLNLLTTGVLHPFVGWRSTMLDVIFMPHYGRSFGGWPIAVLWFSRALVWIANAIWLWPRARPVTRAFSLGFYFGCLYVDFIPVHYPWYLPPPALLASLTWAAIAADAAAWLAAHAPRWRAFVPAAAGVIVAGSASLLLLTAWQMRAHQRVVEATMRDVGLWLHSHARGPTDTVYVEALGYIGFYSNLKMLDDPGLASHEVVDARRMLGDDSGHLVAHLHPDWLVLRPYEVDNIRRTEPGLLESQYDVVQTYDVSAALRAESVRCGAAFLWFDAVHSVYRRKT